MYAEGGASAALPGILGEMQDFTKKLSNFLKNLHISKKIKLTVDVDPINFT